MVGAAFQPLLEAIAVSSASRPPPPPGRLNSLNLERQFRHRKITLKTASRILFPPILNRSHFIVECRNLITLGSAFTRLLLERNSSLLFRLKPPVCITEIISDLSIFFFYAPKSLNMQGSSPSQGQRLGWPCPGRLLDGAAMPGWAARRGGLPGLGCQAPLCYLCGEEGPLLSLWFACSIEILILC